MTVYYLESSTPVGRLPHASEFAQSMSRMDASDLATIRAELNRLFATNEIQTAGWIPGNDWTGTIWSPIYHDAARGNYDIAARIFGLIVFDVAMRRPEAWITGRFEKNGVAIRSLTYFRPEDDSTLLR